MGRLGVSGAHEDLGTSTAEREGGERTERPGGELRWRQARSPRRRRPVSRRQRETPAKATRSCTSDKTAANTRRIERDEGACESEWRGGRSTCPQTFCNAWLYACRFRKAMLSPSAGSTCRKLALSLVALMLYAASTVYSKETIVR